MNGPIVITGGGTGGHIYPMQAIAEQLIAHGVEASELRFVGSRRGQERTLLASSGIELTLLPGRGLRRSFSPDAARQNIGAVIGLLAAMAVALVKVRRWRPSVVVSVGGYASFATSFAAVLWRRPLVLVELDATPGAAQRVLARFAVKQCCAFPTNATNAVVTGAPVRDEVLNIDRSPNARFDARASAVPPIEASRAVVVVMSGSLGSTRVNRAVLELAGRWSNRRDRTIIHVTGQRDYDMVSRERPTTDGLDYRIVAFADMKANWSLCDVAICRAGAMTLNELTILAIPSILVPLPGAPGDHQTQNALLVVEAGGARLVVDADCNGAKLDEVLSSVMEAATLSSMGEAAGTLGRRNGASRIAAEILNIGVAS
jgi:UDP-N-acetylglucosamine--N-acetylmuramyl-(pentapeptide) pyrophosphoryl-undecaprenol N-acetylglucosamine transferase